MRRLAIASISLLPTLALATDWELLTHLAAGGRVEINTARTRDVGNGYHKAWIKVTNDNPKWFDDARTKQYTEVLLLELLDCKRWRTAAEQAIYRDSEGNVVSSFSTPETSHMSMSEAAPDSIADVVLRRVCRS